MSCIWRHMLNVIPKNMHSYHVFVTPKESVSHSGFEIQMQLFLEEQIQDNHLCKYRIIKYSNIANFSEMSEYQIICDYETEEQLKQGFEGMRPNRWKEEPHATMMGMVTDLRVSFSSDVTPK